MFLSPDKKEEEFKRCPHTGFCYVEKVRERGDKRNARKRSLRFDQPNFLSLSHPHFSKKGYCWDAPAKVRFGERE